jgi:autotransporter-associated beta strand protein
VKVARSGDGQFALYGGGTLAVGSGSGTIGVNGGTLDPAAAGVNACFIKTGSTLKINTGGFAKFGSSLVVGDETTGATLWVNGGLLDIGGSSANLVLQNSIASSATVNATLTGGTIQLSNTGNNAGNGALRFGPATGAIGAGITINGTFNLDGGTLTINKVNGGNVSGYTGSGVYNSIFNFNGGTLKAFTAGGASTFVNGLTRANVRNGGAVIDSNGKAITIAQAMRHSNIGGDNATDGGLTLNDSAVTKGSLTLSSANDYTGTTTIQAGTLILSGSGTLGASTAGLTLSGGALDLGALTTPAVGAVSITAAAASGDTIKNGSLTGSSYTASLASGNAIVSANLLGSGIGLTKSGAGTLTLSAANSYSGTTAINAGKLVATTASTGAGAYTVSDSGTLEVQINGAGTSLAMSSLTLGASGGSSLNFILGTGNPSAAPIAVSGALTLNNPTINVTSSGGLTGSDVVLLTYGSGGAGTFTIGSLPTLPGFGITLVNDTVNKQIKLSFTLLQPVLYWGVGNGNWDTATANWTGSRTTFLDGDVVNFDDSASGSSPISVNLTATRTPASVNVAGSKDYVMTGSDVAGASTALAKSGAGKLTLANDNTYAGGTTVTGGTLQVGSGGNSGTLGSGVVTNGGTLAFDRADTALNFANTISGAGALQHNGAGTVTLSGANTYTGSTTINAGTLALSGSGTLGNGGALTVSGGALDLGGLSRTVGAVSITSAAASGDTVKNGSLTGSSYSASPASGNAIVSANLLANGSIGVSMSGAGTLTLAGNNTFTGPTTISAGTVKAGSSTAFGSSSGLSMSGTGTLDLGGYNATFPNITASTSGNTITTTGAGSGTNTLTISSFSTAIAAKLTDNGTRKLAVTLAGSNTDPLSNMANDFSGGLNLGSATRITAVDNSPVTGGKFGRGPITIGTAAQIYFNGANRTIGNDFVVNDNTGNGSRAGAFRVDTAGNTLSGTITANLAPAMFNCGGGNGAILLTGKVTGMNGLTVGNPNGTSMNLTLNTTANLNDYQGTTSIPNLSAALTLGAADQIPNGSGKGNVSLTGTLSLGGFNETINGLSGAGTVDGVSGSPVLILGDGDADGNTFTGTLKNTAGSLSLTKIGTGTQTLSGASTYTGGTAINGGILNVNGTETPNISGPLGASGTISFGGGTLQFGAANTTDYSSRFSSANNQAYSLDTAGQSVSLASALSSSGGTLTKLGSGTLTVSGNNSYSGATTISAGTLRVAHANALGSTSVGTTVASGAALDFNTSITLAAEPITLNGTGISAAGSIHIGSASTAGVTGAVTLGSNASIKGDGNTTINLTGGINLGDYTLTFQGDGGAVTTVATGSIIGNGGLTKSGSAGTLNLTAANGYGGLTTVSSGVLNVQNAGALGSAATGTTVANGARLEVQGGIIVPNEPITINGGGGNFFGALQGAIGVNEWQGPVMIGNQSGTRIGVNGGTFTVSGTISGSTAANGITFRPNSGTLILAGANDYAGDTLIICASGVVKLTGGNNRLPIGTKLNFGTGGTSGTLDLNGVNQEIAGLATISGTANQITNGSITPSTLTVNTATGSPSTWSQFLVGNLALVKAGVDALTLTATNTFVGATTISNGTLTLSGTGALVNTPRITVAAGTTLDVAAVTGGFTLGAAQVLEGNGTVVGATTINGSIAPGTSIGTLTFDTAPTLTGNVFAELNRTNAQTADKLVGLGALGGTLTVTNIGPVLQPGDSFDLFDGSLSGSFVTLNLPGGLAHWNTSDLNGSGTITFSNTAPVAQNQNIGVSQGSSATLLVIGGKRAPTDFEGDALSVIGVGTPTSGSASFSSTSITYLANGNAGTNSFTYTVADAFGATDTKTVTVVVSPVNNGANIVPGSLVVTGSNVTLDAFGIPGATYRLELTEDLSAPVTWTALVGSEEVAAANGAISFDYTHGSALPPTGYFRTVYVSGP